MYYSVDVENINIPDSTPVYYSSLIPSNDTILNLQRVFGPHIFFHSYPQLSLHYSFTFDRTILEREEGTYPLGNEIIIPRKDLSITHFTDVSSYTYLVLQVHNQSEKLINDIRNLDVSHLTWPEKFGPYKAMMKLTPPLLGLLDENKMNELLNQIDFISFNTKNITLLGELNTEDIVLDKYASI